MTTPAKEFAFKVNGTEFTTEDPNPTALEILTIAKRGGAIPNNPEEYKLLGDKGEYSGGDRINLAEDKVFITIPTSSTQAA